MMITDISTILINRHLRYDILKCCWSRPLALKYGKFEYLTPPYTTEDIIEAVRYSQFELVKELHRCIEEKVGPIIINMCQDYEIFKYFYDYFGKEKIDSVIETSHFVERGNVKIVAFLLKNGYTLDYSIIKSRKMYYLLKKNKYDIENDDLDENLLLKLVKKGEINYTLSDAILKGQEDIIGYYLSYNSSCVPDEDDLCSLLDMSFDFSYNDHLELTEDTQKSERIAYELKYCNPDTITIFLNAGFDMDTLMNVEPESYEWREYINNL